MKSRLIEDRSKANYSRCGRTDKGVSAFGQVSFDSGFVKFIYQKIDSGIDTKNNLP